MLQEEFATSIREGYDLLQSLEEWYRSTCTWIADSPLDGGGVSAESSITGSHIVKIKESVHVVLSTYIMALVELRAT